MAAAVNPATAPPPGVELVPAAKGNCEACHFDLSGTSLGKFIVAGHYDALVASLLHPYVRLRQPEYLTLDKGL